MARRSSARRPRRRGRRALLVVGVVVLGLVVVGLLAFRPVDNALRNVLEDQIATSLRQSLALDASTPLTVKVGGGSVIRQIVGGELARVDVSTDSVTFGEFTGPAVLVATAVPIDTSKPVGTLSIDFSISQDQLLKVSNNLSGVPLTAVTVDDSQIEASAELTALFVTVPISVGLLPSAVDGQIAFSPNTISLAGADFSANDLRARFGALAERALTTQNLCIANGLPQVFVLDEVNAEPGRLALHFTADGAVLTPEALAPLGTCPAS